MKQRPLTPSMKRLLDSLANGQRIRLFAPLWGFPAHACDDKTWRRVGPIGSVKGLIARGYLVDTGRRRNQDATTSGKNVAPQPIEAALKATPRIAEALLLGDGEKFVSALIVPGPETTREQVEAEIQRVNAGLAQFEQIKKFELIPDDLTIENGMMTPSLKLKRKAVIERHRAVVARIYSGGG